MTITLAEKHRARRANIDYQKRIAVICAQMGIQSRHYQHHMHPFCWNVKMPWDFNFKQVWDEMVKQHYLSPAEAILEVKDVNAFNDECWTVNYQSDYNCAIEDMSRSFHEDDWAKMLRPHLEKKYHVKCPDSGFDVEWTQEGRSSGWMVLTRFEGISFRNITCSPDHLYMDLEDSDGENWYRRKLCAYLEEACLMLSDDNRKAELLYQLAFQMHLRVEQWAGR